MKKIFFSVVFVFLLSPILFGFGNKDKTTKHAIKKEAKACKKVVCPFDCPPICGGDCCEHS